MMMPQHSDKDFSPSIFASSHFGSIDGDAENAGDVSFASRSWESDCEDLFTLEDGSVYTTAPNLELFFEDMPAPRDDEESDEELPEVPDFVFIDPENEEDASEQDANDPSQEEEEEELNGYMPQTLLAKPRPTSPPNFTLEIPEPRRRSWLTLPKLSSFKLGKSSNHKSTGRKSASSRTLSTKNSSRNLSTKTKSSRSLIKQFSLRGGFGRQSSSSNFTSESSLASF